MICSVTSNFIYGALLKTGQNGLLFKHEGDEVELRCQTTLDNYVSWHFKRTSSETSDEIFSYGQISPQYSEFKVKQDRAAGLYLLVIPHAKTSHSGEYICYDDDGFSSEQISITLNVTSKSQLLKFTI